MASGRPDLRWAAKVRASAAFFLAGAVSGTALYFGNLAYVRAGDEAARAAAPAPAAPPVAPYTVCGTSAAATSAPALCMLNQSAGTADAVWVVQGRGFAPRTSVTVSLTWQGPPQLAPNATFDRTATVKPVVAPDGTLRLNINKLFPRSLRVGRFSVEVIGSGGSNATTVFIVLPPASDQAP